MATFFRNSDKSSSITGDTLYAVRVKKCHRQESGNQVEDISTWRAGVRVPSTSNKTSLLMGLLAKVLGAILSETMVVEDKRVATLVIRAP